MPCSEGRLVAEGEINACRGSSASSICEVGRGSLLACERTVGCGQLLRFTVMAT